jgi:hypothetical protein
VAEREKGSPVPTRRPIDDQRRRAVRSRYDTPTGSGSRLMVSRLASDVSST